MKTWWIDRNDRIGELKDGSGEWATIAMMKFILLRTGAGEVEAFCFEKELEHKNGVAFSLAHAGVPRTSFIGGGTIIRPLGSQAQFNSPSCVAEFGYDRPDDPAEQSALLLDVTGSIRAAGYGKS